MQNNKTKGRIVKEFCIFCCLGLFLFLFFCSLSIYRNLVIDEGSIDHVHYWYLFVEALVLTKILLLGKFLRLGERFLDKPLIIPSLYKTGVFCLFVFSFTLVEHFVIGVFSGEGFWKLYEAWTWKMIAEVIGRMPLFLFCSFPFFALTEIGRFMGKDRLLSLFFKRSVQEEQE